MHDSLLQNNVVGSYPSSLMKDLAQEAEEKLCFKKIVPSLSIKYIQPCKYSTIVQ